MITGLLFFQTDEAIFLHSWPLFLWMMFFFTLNTVCLAWSEEPSLEKRFGETYLDYKRHFPRWLPKFKPYHRETRGSPWPISEFWKQASIRPLFDLLNQLQRQCTKLTKCTVAAIQMLLPFQLLGWQGLHGLHGLHGFLAAQGLQGLHGFLAAQGLQGLHGFLAAQGLQGLHGFLAAQGLQGLQAAIADDVPKTAAVPIVATPTARLKISGRAATVDNNCFLSCFIRQNSIFIFCVG